LSIDGETAMPIPEVWYVVAGIYVADLLRYLLGAGLVFLLLWKVFRRTLAHRRITPEHPPSAQLRREFLYSMSTVVIFAATGFLIYSLAAKGTLTIYEDVDAYGWIYWSATLIALIVLHDLYFYWTHQAMHHPAIFRHVHSVHHRSRNPSPWAAYSFHPVEAIVQAAFLPLALFLGPVHVGVIFLFTLHMIVRNALGHSGVEIYPRDAARSPAFRWLTSVTHHHLHHQAARGNYGLYFSWWDRWMGTEHPDYLSTFDRVTHRNPAAGSAP
jgi:Delta7-sterol 5-desaturase